MLFWATLAALIFGAIEFGMPLENALRSGHDAMQRHAPSGDVVIVAIDDRSLAEVGAWPWKRRHHAALLDRLREQGAKRVFYDVNFSTRSGPDDAILAAALARWGDHVTLPSFFMEGTAMRASQEVLPLPELRRHARIANINFRREFDGGVWQLPYAWKGGGKTTPSFAASIAGVRRGADEEFAPDYAIDPLKLPVVSAAVTLAGGLGGTLVADKDVIIGATTSWVGDVHQIPGYEEISGVYIHAIGAETLLAGTPLDLSWPLPLLLAFAAMILACRVSRLRMSLAIAGGVIALVAGLPLLLEEMQMTIQVMPAIFLVLVVTIRLVIRRIRQIFASRGKTDAVSGLPNLVALRARGGGGGCALIAARIHNYAELAAALSEAEEGVLVRQIAHRLSLGADAQNIYQGDEGIFAWLAPPATAADLGEHLDALHRLFRMPIVVADLPVDASVSFGVDEPGDRPLANRLASALVAADEAAEEGCRWKAADKARLADAPWRLSLLGQLDQAIDNGDLWVAYQAKLDLETNQVCGAEALVRWTHPTKGLIPPLDFILVAEQHDRIERLTRFVLDNAIKAAAEINALGMPFNIAVNLSTRLLGDPAFPDAVAGLLARHQLAPYHLTLEVTETAAIGSNEDNLKTLVRLRDLGVAISIDDYGTGLSTLEYLRKIPSTEIKIDQSFVAGVTRSRSDRLMVHSTIELAHSLGQKVVAEGVEDAATLQSLAMIGCDFAQGFWIGRPLPLHDFTRTLVKQENGLSQNARKRLHG